MKKLGLLFLFFTLLFAACSNDASSEKENEENKEEDKKVEDEVSKDEDEEVTEEEEDTEENEEETEEPENDMNVEQPNSNSSGDVPEDYDFFKEEYINYIDQLNNAVQYETEALNIYNQLIMSNVDDKTAADTIYYDILPVYEQYLSQLEAIQIKHADLQAVNEHLIDTSYLQYNALVTLVNGLDAQDDKLINEAVQLMEMHSTESVNVIYEMAELSEKYGIPYDTDAALEGLEGY